MMCWIFPFLSKSTQGQPFLFPLKAFSLRDSSHSKGMSCPHPSLAPFEAAGHCEAEISIKSQLRWRQTRSPSC